MPGKLNGFALPFKATSCLGRKNSVQTKYLSP